MGSENKQKTSLFKRAIERFSFRRKTTSKQKNGTHIDISRDEGGVSNDDKIQVSNKKPEIFSQPKEHTKSEHDNQSTMPDKTANELYLKNCERDGARVQNKTHVSGHQVIKNQDLRQAFIEKVQKEVDPALNTDTGAKPPTAPQPSLPSSARSYQPLHISQLDEALQKFKATTAASRENISSSRPDISVNFQRSKSLGPAERIKQNVSPSWKCAVYGNNSDFDAQWKKLSSNMLNAEKGSSNRLDRQEELLNIFNSKNMSGSNSSLPVVDFTETSDRNNKVRERTQSISALDSNPEDFRRNMPNNQLSNLNNYQQRIIASTNKLDLPKWSKNTGTMTRHDNQEPKRRVWENSAGNASLLNTTNAGRRSLTPSQRFRYKTQDSTPSTPRQQITQNKPIYLGWRQSGDQLNQGVTTFFKPRDRSYKENAELASDSIANDASHDIQKVTADIIDFCNSVSHDTDRSFENGKQVTFHDNDSGIEESLSESL